MEITARLLLNNANKHIWVYIEMRITLSMSIRILK